MRSVVVKVAETGLYKENQNRTARTFQPLTNKMAGLCTARSRGFPTFSRHLKMRRRREFAAGGEGLTAS
jgi:hypothetical protein